MEIDTCITISKLCGKDYTFIDYTVIGVLLKPIKLGDNLILLLDDNYDETPINTFISLKIIDIHGNIIQTTDNSHYIIEPLFKLLKEK